MPITYNLEHPDGTPVDPPTFKSAAGISWNIGDPLYLGRRTLRVVDVRDEDANQPPVLIVELVKLDAA
jgi:hypothetical protein